MLELIATVGKNITERWLSAILLSGLLYMAVVGWVLLAGQRHALDLPWLAARITDLWQHHASSPGTAVVITAVLLGGAGLAGMAVTMIAEEVVHRLWTIRGPLGWLDTRQERTKAEWEERDPRPPSRYLPGRATVIGEHFRLIGERVDAQYGLSVILAWPRIWLLANADTRTLIGAAYRRYYSDAALAAWGVLYLPWTLRWWPAAVIAATLLALGYRRAVASSAVLATLIEATVDAHTKDLADRLGVKVPEGRVTPEDGNRINDILNKRA